MFYEYVCNTHVHVHVCVLYMCVQIYKIACVHCMWRLEVKIGCFLYHSTTYFGDKVCKWIWSSLSWWMQLAHKPRWASCFSLLSSSVTGIPHCAHLFISCWGSNLAVHAWMASLLLPEPSPLLLQYYATVMCCTDLAWWVNLMYFLCFP